MGATCSKGSSTGISGQQLKAQPSFSQYSNSPYLADNASFTHLSGHAAKSASVMQQDNGLIQAHHNVDSALQPLDPPFEADTGSVTAISPLEPTSVQSVSSSTERAPSSAVPSIVQHSLKEAAAVYTQPSGRTPYKSPGKAPKLSSHAKHAIAKSSTFPAALKAIGKQAGPETAGQLLQHYVFNKQAVTVTELDSTLAAISGQPAQTQAVYAALLTEEQYYFAAMKATFTHPKVLQRVLQDIQQQVGSCLGDIAHCLSSLSA